MAVEVWSIGHSTHPLDAFAGLLRGQRVTCVADVRTVPRSRRHPHFRTEELAASLPALGVRYEHLRRLGGWRRAREDSPNGGWENASFRGYADHALGPDFAAGLAELLALAADGRTAMMCSEALWWRCHRRLIADRVVAGGGTVWHIGADGRVAAHVLTSFGVVQPDGTVLYPGP